MFGNLKERHAELVEASLPLHPGLDEAVEMLRQAQHDVLKAILAKSKHALKAGCHADEGSILLASLRNARGYYPAKMLPLSA